MDQGWLARWLGRTDASEEPPVWSQELAEGVKRIARSQAKLTAELESALPTLAARLDALFVQLERSARTQSAEVARPSARPLRWEGMFDALDLLDQAGMALERSGQAESARGLRGVLVRLEAFAADAGHERVAARGLPIDGRRFRVVGTEDRPDLAEGVVTCVVRAAVVCAGELVREGEVIVNQRAT